MAAIRHVAVIDLGKTNAKVALFDLDTQHEIEKFTMPNHVLNDGPYPHFDTDALWAFMLRSLASLASKVDAISITTHGASAALLDADGALALPVLDYEYAGPESLAEEYNRQRPPFSETGAPRLPIGLNLGAQIYWQQKAFPEHFAKVRWIVTYPQYWAHRLCGVLANEATSLGCHTDLWAYAKADYSTMVDRMGWRKLMPPLRKASDVLGGLLPDLARQTGLSVQTPIYCGIHDSNASLYPHLLAGREKLSVVSTGTWVIGMAIGADATALDPARDVLVNVNALGEPVPSARFMGGREFQLLATEFGGSPSVADAEAVITKHAMLVPSVVTGCGPFPDRKMQWLNADAITPAQRQICVSFYLGLMTATCLELIGAQGDVIVEGPFSENQFYLQMLAAATQRNVLLSPASNTGTTLGAALLASKDAGPMTYQASTIAAPANSDTYIELWRAALKA